jgi:Na+/H+ antiporter NhaC
MEYGWLSLIPPTVAIFLAIATRRVIPSLLIGVMAGTLVLKDWSTSLNPLTVIGDLLETHLWASFCDPDHLRVFVFTSLMGAMIGVIHRSGGMEGIVNALAPLARSRRGGQLLTWFLGLLIFIDDYANSLLLGHTMRPLADRLRISREKLAYLVDSTAAPVSGLALVSTWVAGEIGYIESGFESLALPSGAVDGFGIFVATIPFRFYVLFALLFVPLVGWLGRDFGPMWKAERQCLGAAPPHDVGRSPSAGDASGPQVQRWHNAVVPIGVTLVVTVWLLMLTGRQALAGVETESSSWQRLVQVFGNGDSYLALLYGSLAGLLTAMFLARGQKLMSWAEANAAAMEGARLVVPALLILWLAWALSGVTSDKYLGTGEYLGSLLQAAIDVRWMPTIVFLLSSLVAFSTGTSWGTMGILMPIVVAATFRMVESQQGAAEPYNMVLIASIGSVLAGAIFGDHCSPISDTTVLSSQASGCDHMSHVWTQLPYALTVAAVSIVVGTVPAGFGWPVWPLLAVGGIVLVLILRLFGKAVDRD